VHYYIFMEARKVFSH